MSVAKNLNPKENLNHDGAVCAICGHPQSDHPMNDVCWREMAENGQVKLCSCPGFRATLNAAAASDQAG